MFAVPEMFCLRLYSFSFLSFVNDIVWYSPRQLTFPNRKNLTTLSSFSQKMFWVRIPHVTGRANSSKPSFISFVKKWHNRRWQTFSTLWEKSNFLLELPRNMFLNIPIDSPCVRFIVKLSSRNGREWSQEDYYNNFLVFSENVLGSDPSRNGSCE